MADIVLRVTGLLFIGVGVLLLTAFDGTTIQVVGLGLWSFGTLVIVDVSLRLDGLRAQLLWGFGVGAAVYALFYTNVPHALSKGIGGLILAIATVGLTVAVFLRPPHRQSPLVDLLGELRDKAAQAALPERPADPVAEIARLQAIMMNLLAEIRANHPREATELSELLHQYRSHHGSDTIDTSSRPTALRNAVAVLVDDMEAIRDRLTTDVRGYPQAVLLVAYARQMANLVLDRTR